MIIVVCVVLLVGLVGVAFLSRKEQGDCLVRMSRFVYKQLWGLGMLRSGQVETDLERLYPGQSVGTLQIEYYTEKIRLLLLVLGVGTILTFILCVKTQIDGGGKIQALERGGVGTGSEEVRVVASVGKQKEEMVVYVEEQNLTETELKGLFIECAKDLEQIIPGANKDLNDVTTDLVLVDSLEEYPFEISWKSSDSLLISATGELKEVQGREGEVVCMTAILSYGENRFEQEYLVELGQVTREYSLQDKLYTAIKEQDEASRYGETLPLPISLDGEEVQWERLQEEKGPLFLGLTLLAAIGVFFLKDKDLHEQVLERRKQLKLAYPSILNKYVLYMSAGMTIRGSFQKIALDSQRKEKQDIHNPAYEEMLYSCNELSAGVSEAVVYERFGKRSGLQEYARFAGMLGQNLKKGNSALLERLREEADKAMQENLQFRKKLGEEAETKLLVPMIMMMGIVMLLVMIPAFTSFE